MLFGQFRALGGIAENVTVRNGPRGRGVFAVDPAMPVRVLVPPNLLIPCKDTEVRNGNLVVKESSFLGKAECAFFNWYQHHFSWGAGVFDDLWQTQLAWSRLAQNVRTALSASWPLQAEALAEPSEDLCRQRYLNTRMIKVNGEPVLIPVLELVNHGSCAAGYDRTKGVAVEGLFVDEVLAKYGADDCWGTAMAYGFCEARDYAYAIQGAFKFEGYRIEIARAPIQSVNHNGSVIPIVRVEEKNVHFSFLVLGDAKSPLSPRSVFLRAVKDAPIVKRDMLFDLIQHYNRELMLNFLRGSEGPATPLVAMLRCAAYQQLETLSHHWGTGPLSATQEAPDKGSGPS